MKGTLKYSQSQNGPFTECGEIAYKEKNFTIAPVLEESHLGHPITIGYRVRVETNLLKYDQSILSQSNQYFKIDFSNGKTVSLGQREYSIGYDSNASKNKIEKYKINIDFYIKPSELADYLPVTNVTVALSQFVDISGKLYDRSTYGVDYVRKFVHSTTHQRFYFVVTSDTNDAAETRFTNYVAEFDEDGTFLGLYEGVSGELNSYDHHGEGCIVEADDGNLIIAMAEVQGDSHNFGIRIAKTTTPGDLSTFQDVTNRVLKEPGDVISYGAYPTLHKFNNGRIVCFFRYGFASNDHYRGMLFYSDDNGATWTMQGVFGDLQDGNLWFYKYKDVMNFTNSDTLNIYIRRYNNTIGDNDRLYYIETNDGITFRNRPGTFVKNVVQSGAITLSEFEQYCKVIDLSGGQDGVHNYGMTIGEDGKVYISYGFVVGTGKDAYLAVENDSGGFDHHPVMSGTGDFIKIHGIAPVNDEVILFYTKYDSAAGENKFYMARSAKTDLSNWEETVLYDHDTAGEEIYLDFNIGLTADKKKVIVMLQVQPTGQTTGKNIHFMIINLY